MILLANGGVYVWGGDSSGQESVPPGLTNVIAIAAGGYGCLALQANETVVAWGDDSYGETNIPSAATNVVAIAAGNGHDLALRSDGTVVAWGSDLYGQTDIPAGVTDVVAIAAEGSDSFVLQANGTVVAWGQDYFGQGGVIPGLSNVVAISADLAIQSDGIVVPLGDATYDEREIPSGLTNVVAVSGGDTVGMALVGTGPPLVSPLINEFAFSGASVLFTASVAGAFPLSYQWQFNGTNLTGANQSSLVLTNVQSGNSGSYTVTITNASGATTSSPSELTVINSGPIITSQPGNMPLPPGNIASFTVAATGSQPLSYQWQFDGTNISGATNASLWLPGVNETNAGQYTVMVTNAFGSVLSTNATLALVPSVVVGWGSGGSVTNIPANLTNAVEIANGGIYGLALTADGSVVAWGDDTFGETDIPLNLGNVVEIFTRNDYGNGYSLALTADGAVYAWGDNTYGECDVPYNLTNAIDILPASSSYLPMALTADGRVVEWSAYATNYLSGDTAVPAGLSNVVAIAEGGCNLALQSNGKVIAWGDPYNGLTNVPANLSNVVAIAAGGTSLLALSANGQVAAWGGITNVPAGLTNVVAIAAGQNDFDVAITANGNAVAWGDYFLEELTPQQLYAATNVPASITNATTVIAGNYGCLTLNQNTTVAGWGDDSYEIEMNIPPWLTNVAAIAASPYYSGMALEGHLPPVALPMANVFAYSGSSTVILEANARGFPLSYQWQLNGTNLPGANQPWLLLTNVQTANSGSFTVVASNAYGTASNTVPLVVANSAPIILQQPQSLELPPDNNFTFSVDAIGSQPISYQWQFNGTNIAGATSPSLTVTNAQLPAAGYYSVVLNNPYGMLISSNAGLSFSITSVAAWGGGGYGELNNMPTNLTDVTAVSAGAYHNLALLADGTVFGWGNDEYGQVDIPAGLTNATAIAGGEWHSLALKADGTVIGWGDDVFGEIDVPSGLSNVISIAAGSYTSMALQSNGLVTVWGDTYGGQTNVPPVPPGLTNVVSIAISGPDFLALRSNGTVVEWGDNYYGQTNFASSLTNIIAIGSGASALANLAVKADGTVTIWGYVPPYMDVPPGLSNVVAVAAGSYFCLAMLADRTVVAWGEGPEPGYDNDLDIPPGLTNVTAIGCGYGHGIVLDPAGGVITLEPIQGTGQGQVGYLQATLAPPAAVSAGAGWGIVGQPYFSSNTNFTVAVTTNESVALTFQSVNGWEVPASRAVAVPLGGLTNVNISYTVSPPLMSVLPGTGIGITGTTNTTYRIQYSTNLTDGQWLTLTTNTLGQGFNEIAPWPPNNGPAKFYRAVWLP